MKTIRFGSVCSGIEAASVAWNPLGWKAAWLSEIEPFPSAVLAHHYPDVPNLGDMTKLPDRIRSGDVEAPDVFCGGTPCQAFSIAGLRKSLDDARGNLSLVFCEIADAIDSVRLSAGNEPAIIFWENVPGVISTSDNAFGCFLAGLAGEDDPLEPPGGKWTNAGYVLGPQRAVAWRVLDAQYFGVAQRRRRVFVVASARTGFDPAAVIFEFDGVRRDSAPSREAGEIAAGTIASRTDGGGFPGTDEACSGYIQPAVRSVCPTLRAGGNRTGGDRPPGTDVDTADSLLPTYAIQAGALRTNPASGPGGVGVQEGHAYTLEARAEVQAVCVTGQVTHTLKAEGFDASEDVTVRGTPLVPVGVTIHGTDPTVQKVASYDDIAQCLRARTPGNIDNSSTTVVQQPIVVHGTQDPCVSNHTAFALGRNNGGENAIAASEAGDSGCSATEQERGGQSRLGQTPFAVRRLTCEEAEFLQGFPRGYTKIPWRKKPASDCPDGPRYRALGNSWAVPNVRWIGRRIDAQLRACAGSISKPLVTEEA